MDNTALTGKVTDHAEWRLKGTDYYENPTM